MSEVEQFKAGAWYPIEIFPKQDGMVVDLFIPMFIERAHLSRSRQRVCGAHWAYGSWLHRYESDAYMKTATHWMPEPEFPPWTQEEADRLAAHRAESDELNRKMVERANTKRGAGTKEGDTA